MKNQILKNLSCLDRVFPVVMRLPYRVRSSLPFIIASVTKRHAKRKLFPDRITIFITDRCNLRCPHCFVSNPGKEATPEMSLREYELFFRKARGKISQINVTGGEPTLRHDLASILILASQEANVDAATVFSNGILQDRLIEAAEQTISECRIQLSFQVSIDGMKALHNTIRGNKDAFQKTISTMKGLLELKQRHPQRVARMIVCTTISKANLHKLTSVIECVREKGFSHSFTFVRTSENGVFNLRDRELVSEFAPVSFHDFLTVDEMEAAMKILYRDIWNREWDKLSYATNRVTLQTIVDSVRTSTPQAPCFSGIGDIVILPDGGVSRCEMLSSFANLRDYEWDLQKLLRSDVAAKHFAKTKSCWCIHDCSIAMSIMYDKTLILNLLSKPLEKSSKKTSRGQSRSSAELAD